MTLSLNIDAVPFIRDHCHNLERISRLRIHNALRFDAHAKAI